MPYRCSAVLMVNYLSTLLNWNYVYKIQGGFELAVAGIFLSNHWQQDGKRWTVYVCTQVTTSFYAKVWTQMPATVCGYC